MKLIIATTNCQKTIKTLRNRRIAFQQPRSLGAHLEDGMLRSWYFKVNLASCIAITKPRRLSESVILHVKSIFDGSFHCGGSSDTAGIALGTDLAMVVELKESLTAHVLSLLRNNKFLINRLGCTSALRKVWNHRRSPLQAGNTWTEKEVRSIEWITMV